MNRRNTVRIFHQQRKTRYIFFSLPFFFIGIVPARADIITDWNTIVAQVLRADSTLPGPTYGSRTFAMVHLAIYDAVNAIHRTHQPYLLNATAEEGTSVETAVSQAAHDVLVSIYPAQAGTLDAALATHLDAIPDGPSKTAGVALGQSAAEVLIRTRSVDNAFDNEGPIPDGTLPGQWRRTPPDFTDALGPYWGSVHPFVIRSGPQFRPPMQPDLTSPEYAAAFNEVKEIGELNSSTRTAEQTEIGIFWGYDRGGMGPPPIFYNQIVQVVAANQGNSVQENARLFALVNAAQADGGILCWEGKYLYDFWRPITAIRLADQDDNDATVADPNWEPLGAPGGGVVPNFTPPFPAYTSGHATFGAATFRILENYYGRDDISFTVGSDELPGMTRTFSSFSQAAEENGQSRIYLGIHWSFDKVFAIQSGRRVADFVYHNILKPLPNADLNGDGKIDGKDLILFQEGWYNKRGN